MPTDYYPAPDELRDDYINESTSFPGEDNSEPLANLDDPEWVLRHVTPDNHEPEDWYKNIATFESLWKLAGEGNQDATEELLARQWEYNREHI